MREEEMTAAGLVACRIIEMEAIIASSGFFAFAQQFYQAFLF